MLREQIGAQAGQEQLQLAIAYLQFRSRRIEALEQDRRRLEERKASVEGQIEQLTGEVEAGEKRLQEMTPQESEGWHRQLERMRRAITTEKDEADRLDTRIIDLENEIADGRRRLADIEDFVLENLRLGD